MRHRDGMRHLFSNRPVHDGGALRADRDLLSVHSAHSYHKMEMTINNRPCPCFNCETAKWILIKFYFGGRGELHQIWKANLIRLYRTFRDSTWESSRNLWIFEELVIVREHVGCSAI